VQEAEIRLILVRQRRPVARLASSKLKVPLMLVVMNSPGP